MVKNSFWMVLAAGSLLSFNVLAEDITIVAQTNPNDDSTKCGDNCSWVLYSNGKLEIQGTGNMYDFTQWSEDSSFYRTNWHTNTPWADFSASIHNVTVADGITSIGVYSFWDTAVTSVSLPESIKRLGLGAFQYSDLEQANLPTGLETIQHAAFHASYVTDLVIPETVTSIDSHAFGSLSLQHLTIEGDVQIDERMFLYDDGVSPTLTNIYCLATNESCNNLKSDNTIGDKITSYTKELGVYQLEDGTMFTSATDMMNAQNACADLTSCQATVLQNKGYCETSDECLSIASTPEGEIITVGGKQYASLNDLYNGNALPDPEPEPEPIATPEPSPETPTTSLTNTNFTAERGKRIYTLKEANQTAGKKNTVMIRYK